MELNVKQIAVSALVLLAIGAIGGKYAASSGTKTEIKTTEQDKTKTDIAQIENDDKDITIDEIKLPDGTIQTKTHIVDKDHKETNTKIDQSISKTSDTIVTSSKTDWDVSLLASMSHNGDNFIPGEVSYGLHIERRILGPFKVGIFAISNRTYGISVGASF